MEYLTALSVHVHITLPRSLAIAYGTLVEVIRVRYSMRFSSWSYPEDPGVESLYSKQKPRALPLMKQRSSASAYMVTEDMLSRHHACRQLLTAAHATSSQPRGCFWCLQITGDRLTETATAHASSAVTPAYTAHCVLACCRRDPDEALVRCAHAADLHPARSSTIVIMGGFGAPATPSADYETLNDVVLFHTDR